MADFSLSGEITGDASGFLAAIQQATDGLSTFASVAAGVFAGAGAADLFGAFTSGISNMVSTVVGTASDFQSYGQTISGLLDNVGSSGTSMGDAVSGGNAKAAASALEAQDAFAKYQEKIAEINQNIADVMSGTNITTAVDNYQTKLEDAQQAYADKVASINQSITDATDAMNSTIADKQQSVNDSLADMKAAHDVKVADTAEKQAQELANATTATAKAALEKKFQEQNQLEVDSFNRSYALKQSQEQRSLDETKAKATEAANDKIAKYQAELTKEAEAEQDKEAKMKKQEDIEIARLTAENTKKLALYQRELADEERSYQLSLAKRAASGGGGGGNRIGLGTLAELEDQSIFSYLKDVQEGYDAVQQHIQAFALSSPFQLKDIEQSDTQITAMGYSVEKLNPIIGNLSAYFHQSFGTGTQAMMDALNGRSMMLEHTFGISTKQLEAYNNGMKITNKEQFLDAMTKMTEAEGKFAGGLQKGLNTLPGQMSNIQDRIGQVMAAFMGLDSVTEKPIPGGIFDILMKNLLSIAEYLEANKQKIDEFAAKIGGEVADNIKKFIEYLIDHRQDIMNFFEAIGTAIGIVVTVINGFVSFIKDHFDLLKSIFTGFVAVALIAIALLAPVWIPVVASVVATGLVISAFVALAIALFLAVGTAIRALAGHFNDFKAGVVGVLEQIKDGWNTFWGFISGIFDKLTKGLGDLGNNATKALSFLNPFAKHSPSLVEQVAEGVNQIKSAYESIGNMNIQAPSLGVMGTGIGGGLGSGGIGNYNTAGGNTTSTSVTMNNAFNVNSASTANIAAEYLAFMLEQRGLV